MNKLFLFSGEVAKELEMTILDVQYAGKLMKIKKIYGSHVWFEKDVKKLKRFIK